MAKNPKERELTLAQRVAARIQEELDIHLADPVAAGAAATTQRAKLPPEAADLLDDVLRDPRKSYRDATIIQLAFGLEDASGAVDHTIRPGGARSVGADLGTIFNARHIAGVRDAYQNIGKNSDRLDRGNVPSFDEALRWFNTADEPTRDAAFGYVLAKVSLTARAVLPMPEIDRAKLTFHACAVLFDELMRKPSGGAYQQFGVAACLHAVIEEFDQGGAGGLRVETKNLNASDASSRVAGDIQIMRGNRTEEAFEVTANDWRSKVAPAIASAKGADLQRVHIIAAVEAGFPADSDELAKAPVDLTVIDVSAYLRTLLAVMRKPARAAALVRLYELLDRLQPDVERTNAYVRLLRDHGLAAA